MLKVCAYSLSCVRLFASPWTAAHQAPLSTGILQASIAMEWVAMPFSRGPSQPGNLTQGLSHCRGILYCLSHKGRQNLVNMLIYLYKIYDSYFFLDER